MLQVKIIQLRKNHIGSLLLLMWEFHNYLDELSSSPRWYFDTEKKREKILKDGFWKNPQYRGYIAKIGKKPVGYILYHYGYDPDEMEWKVVHVIDLFVNESARGYGVGRILMKKLQDKEDIIALYFWVWKKNTLAIEFYKRLGADWITDVPYMCLRIL